MVSRAGQEAGKGLGDKEGAGLWGVITAEVSCHNGLKPYQASTHPDRCSHATGQSATPASWFM